MKTVNESYLLSPIYYAVPKILVLGPVLLFMYTMPIEDIIFRHGFLYMMHDDDIQLYITSDGFEVPTGTSEVGIGFDPQLDEEII